MELSTIVFFSAIGLALLGLTILVVRGNRSNVKIEPKTNITRSNISLAPQSAYGKYVHNIPALSFQDTVDESTEGLNIQLPMNNERTEGDGILTAVIVAAILRQDGIDQPVDLVEETTTSPQEYEASNYDYHEPPVPVSAGESDLPSVYSTD